MTLLFLNILLTLIREWIKRESDFSPPASVLVKTARGFKSTPPYVIMVTDSMVQSPSLEANSHSASQEIPGLLWKPKVRYCVHSNSPMVPVLSQMHPVHTFPPYFPKIHSNIILSSTTRSSEWSLPFRFSDQNFVRISHLSRACYIPTHLILIDFVTLIIFGEEYKLWSSSLCSLLQPPATSSFLDPAREKLYLHLIHRKQTSCRIFQINSQSRTQCPVSLVTSVTSLSPFSPPRLDPPPPKSCLEVMIKISCAMKFLAAVYLTSLSQDNARVLIFYKDTNF
jgi:hypothetical protein